MSDSEPNFDPYHSTLTYAGNGHMEVVCPCRNFQLEHRVENIQYLPLQWATITTVTRDVYREHLSHTHMLSCRLSSQVAIFCLKKLFQTHIHDQPFHPAVHKDAGQIQLYTFVHMYKTNRKQLIKKTVH